ncbi:F0F1 ATP synthase subunit A [Methylocaldum sp.]|uniref:F0F1 ATP synthase subunit A n=1 Tax=Methylocaldum sp. TaxID=1969727 RepID=UPI002D23A307|nr:F0F1 ATP synthase subunit A [Methylocaldum sp.]HYE34418.1 F0F1 ATP synthase subunit A [Methylocaldum sp.]
MEHAEPIALLSFDIGSIHIGPTVLTTWLLMILLGVFSWLATRRLKVDTPSGLQAMLEGVIGSMEEAIRAVAPAHGVQLLPFIGTLWIYLVMANLTGLIPGLGSPTADLSATAALALLVFFSVHWYGVKTSGWGYLRHYLAPTPLMLPFHLLSEISRTIALAMRLFGNIMSLELAVLLVLLIAGFLAPVPLLLLHIVEALVQAYIFGMLALIYIAGALQTQPLQK